MCGRDTYLFKWKQSNRLKDLTHTYDRPGNRLTRYDGRPGARMPNLEFEYEYEYEDS